MATPIQAKEGRVRLKARHGCLNTRVGDYYERPIPAKAGIQELEERGLDSVSKPAPYRDTGHGMGRDVLSSFRVTLTSVMNDCFGGRKGPSVEKRSEGKPRNDG